MTTHADNVAAAVHEPLDLSAVDRIVAEIGRGKESAIPILQAMQEHFRYLPQDALIRVCEITDISPAQIMGVSTFYSQFRHLPVGRHLVSVCHGTACHVAGAEAITEAIRMHLGIEEESDTDADGLFTMQKVACLGCCSLAPCMRVDDLVYGPLTPDTAPKTLGKFLRDQSRRKAKSRKTGPTRFELGDPGVTEIRLGLLSCCVASGNRIVKQAMDDCIQDLSLPAVVKRVGCVGMCHEVPVLQFLRHDGACTAYGRAPANVIPNIVRAHAKPIGPFRKAQALIGRTMDLLFAESAWEPPAKYRIDPRRNPLQAFLAKQKHIVLEGCLDMDSLDIDEYEARGGYDALKRCVMDLEPDEIIAAVGRSGLRGRGGAGFPIGRKWAHVQSAPGPKKYVVMNGDEGDPGAFMDRLLLEALPHRALEGIAIAARAVAADEGYLYIRAEYPLAVERVREAIRQAEERGYLGERILGTDFSLKLHLMPGAGAFVCGEETALMASIEGKRGMPRLRPPYPAESGLWGKPTNINNVETYANVPWIIRNGPEAFAAIGTDTSKGTKVFALAGKVARGGLIEVPMGITIGEIVEGIGGGVPDGRTFKAVQIGGPSGGCLPASLRDLRIDFEDLTQYGAIMGSGGLVVMDETACMVDIARYFLEFTENESCGKCTFCRVGTKRMLEILERFCSGEGKRSDIDKLHELANRVKRTSLCGLGQTAPNPVLTTLRYFRHEYEAHIDGRCPAKKCRALIKYKITDDCMGCTLCAQHCPAQAITMQPYEKHEIDQEKCVRCGTCHNVCPMDAVEVE